jgi:hypothetical protein
MQPARKPNRLDWLLRRQRRAPSGQTDEFRAQDQTIMGTSAARRFANSTKRSVPAGLEAKGLSCQLMDLRTAREFSVSKWAWGALAAGIIPTSGFRQ